MIFLLTEGGIIEIGPLQLVIHIIQNCHVRERETHWDKTNKELASIKMVISLVFLVLVSLILSSMAVFYHVND